MRNKLYSDSSSGSATVFCRKYKINKNLYTCEEEEGDEEEKEKETYVRLSKEELDISNLINRVQCPTYGAVAVFIGTTRNFSSFPKKKEKEDEKDEDKIKVKQIEKGVHEETMKVMKRKVKKLIYEAYEDMAIKQIESICDEVRCMYPHVGHIAVEHKIGECDVGMPGVNICVSSYHRKDALNAVSYIINEIKKKVTIWKKEVYLPQIHNKNDEKKKLKDTNYEKEETSMNKRKKIENDQSYKEEEEEDSLWKENEEWDEQLTKAAYFNA